MDEDYVQSVACIFNNCSETCRGSLTCFMQHNHRLPTVFRFLTCRSNARFNNTFLQTTTDFQRGKKKTSRKQLLYRFSQPYENWTTQVVLQYFNFQCQIYEQWANNYPRRKGVETGMRKILPLLLCRATDFWKKPGTIHLSVPDECSPALQTS